MPKKSAPQPKKDVQRAGPKSQEPTPKARKAPRKDESGKARKAAREMGEQQAQRAAKDDGKQVKRAAKDDNKKTAQRAAKTDEKPVQRAAKADEKPVQRAAKTDEKPVQRAANADEKPVQRAAKTDEMPVQRAAAGSDVHVSDGKDAYEREAKQIGADVAAGQEIAPQRIGASARNAARAKKEEGAARKAAKPPEQKTKPAPAAQKADAPPTAAATAPTAAVETPDQIAMRAIRTKGSGVPLAPGTRAILEEKLGVPLGYVRVHDSGPAREAAQSLNARAFTNSHHIWLGPGESQSDIALMAHEVAHVLQQARGAPESLVQREEGDGGSAAPDTGDWDYEGTKGKIKKNSRISIPVLKVPKFKEPPVTPSPLKLAKKTGDRETKQLEVWEADAAAGDTIEKAVGEKADEDKAPSTKKDGKPAFFMELPGQDFFVVGSKDQIKERMLRPFWTKKGKKQAFHVDHKQEYQLRQPGEDPDRLSNLWLLDAVTNQASGKAIATHKQELVEALLVAATKKKKTDAKSGTEEKPPEPGDKSAPVFTRKPDYDAVRKNYSITFEKVEGGLSVAGPLESWDMKDIKDETKQVKLLKTLDKKAITDRGLKGTQSKIVIYTSETGGYLREVPWPQGATKAPVTLTYGKPGKTRAFGIDEVEWDESKDPPGLIRGTAFKGFHLLDDKPFELPIQRMDLIEFGGFIPPSAVSEKFKQLNMPGASPIEMYFIELTNKGLSGRGRLLPTVPLIKDIGIDLVLDGEDIYLSKTFTAEEFKFPGPITVTSSSLEIYAGTIGIGARGTVMFEISRLGEGRLSGSADVKEGFAIEGEFNFDSELFDPARITVGYKKDTFYGEGEIGIPEGKVRGIKTANFKASFVNDKIDAVGNVKPSIPGIEQGNLEFHYAPETGMVIGGRLDLKKDIPGLAGGFVQAELSRPPDSDKWRVKANGEAKPKIPGLDTTLLITYDDGAFDASATASYDKGMLKGAVTVGLTNRPVGPDGVPAGAPGEKSDAVILYGGGSLTMRVAPWLQGTAAIRILPNGEIEVAGEIALPSTLDIFEEKKLDKNIFKIGLDIPIVGVAVAGQRIGIFANITGGLDLTAGLGPGQLQEAYLRVTYNPAHEDQTHVEGSAKLHIPAHAGLRMFVRGGLGVGIPIVSAQAGLEIGGQLGLEGALDAGVQVDWMPNKGLTIDALGEVYVQPKFTFDVTGFVLVEADLWITTIELYSQRWQLAKFSYGSDLRFGLKFPIHYEEGKPFDVSLSDVQFEVPTVDPMSMLKGLIDKIA
ncbi:MAG: DUF4157 domain-containing protein [Gemmatimonadota bacterium]